MILLVSVTEIITGSAMRHNFVASYNWHPNYIYCTNFVEVLIL